MDSTDFSLTTTGVTGASVTSVSGSGATRTVTVNTGSRLDMQGGLLTFYSGVSNGFVLDSSVVVSNIGGVALAGSGVTYAITNDTPTRQLLRGTNGVPYLNYRVLSTTNVSLPQAQWTPFATNTFGARGNFDCTNAFAPTDSQRYLRLVMTAP